VPLVGALSRSWQYAVLAGAAMLLLASRRNAVLTLLAAGDVGVLLVGLGAPLTM
jgi:hypothetical protein